MEGVEVCEQLREMDAMRLIVYCCVKYVERHDKGIVMQVLGIISSMFGVLSTRKSQGGNNDGLGL